MPVVASIPKSSVNPYTTYQPYFQAITSLTNPREDMHHHQSPSIIHSTFNSIHPLQIQLLSLTFWSVHANYVIIPETENPFHNYTK
jgi:hypothetical protein